MRKPAFYLPLVLTIGVIMFVVTTAIITLAYSNFRLVKHQSNSTSALNVAEAGVNYYLWHLSHNNTDYCDGTSCSGNGPFGPYTHNFYDDSGKYAGSYAITITPPILGSNSVQIRSVGTAASGEKRTIQATLGIPSFAQYSFVSNSEAWFGSNESTAGLVHSNVGIHYDGTANGVVSSASSTYVPSTCFGGDGKTTEPGVWGNGGPTTYWDFPVPQVDFNSVTSDLNTLKTVAQQNGIYLPTTVANKNQVSRNGYALQLNADGTIRVGTVTSSKDNAQLNSSCGNNPNYYSIIQSVSWEATARPAPANGVVFVEDNAWVWGTVGSRLTIASARLPDIGSTNTDIFLQGSINYTAKDGSVALGLVSQSDLVLNPNSDNVMELDAYLMSQKGKVFRPYYGGNTKSSITTYGGIASNSWWTWSWVNSSNTVTSGYQTTNQTFDTHLTLNPPPQFPETGSFAVLSWREEPIL